VKTITLKAVSILLLTLALSPAHAQVDPTSAFLIRNGGYSPEPDDLDADRFTKKTASPNPAANKKRSKIVERASAAVPVAAAPTPGAAPAPESALASGSVIGPTPTPTVAAMPLPALPKPSLTEQVKSLFLGGSEEEIEGFRKQIDSRDRRNNRMEIGVAPSYFYNNSASSYSIRRFNTSGPSIALDTKVWPTPFFGIHGSYFSSLDSSMSSSGPKQVVPADYQNIEIGLRFRKHFGVERKAPCLTWGLDYVNNSLRVPGETTDRVSTYTSGLSISLEADLPKSTSYSHILGVQLQPRLVHSENSNSQIHSGGNNNSNAIGAWFGGEIIFDRRNQIFWKIQERLEKNTFDGSASKADPVTGFIPSGSAVNNSITVFSIGYRWGA
jgi:hypothetical protein